MLHNISTKKTASPQETAPAQATRPVGTIQPSAHKANSPEDADVQRKVQRKEIESEPQAPTVAVGKEAEDLSPPRISQGDLPALSVRTASINHVQSLIPEMKNKVDAERFTSPLSLANAPRHPMEKKQGSAQEPERVTDMPVTDMSVPTKKEDNRPFADILSQESSFKTPLKTPQKEIPAGAHQPPPRQKETSSLFSKAPYQKVPVVKANLKKIRKNSKKKGGRSWCPKG